MMPSTPHQTLAEAPTVDRDDTELAAFDTPIDRALLLDNLHERLFGDEPKRSLAPAIGRFSILRKLGEGGMGAVYLGYDEQLDRKAAVKLVRAAQASPRAQQRMLREAQGLARLSHPNVVQIYESGTHEGALFIAMEFVAGQTLGEWLAEQRRGRPEILAVFTEAGRGLAAAHAVKLIHRDFKPDNVMIGDDGRVKVMDFGLVRTDEEGEVAETTIETPSGAVERLTQTGALLGTPAYMAPEQLSGVDVDTRSDQFSFCVALWEALHGQRPFTGTTMRELSEAITTAEPRAPRASDVPAWLRAVIERGLAKRPADRWPSMDALLAALARDPRRRRRRVLGLVMGIAGLTGIGWGAAELAKRDTALCQDMGADLIGTWDETRKAAVESAFTATGQSYASETWIRVETSLDRWTSRWVEARTETCEATQAGTQSGELLDLRMACLDRELHEVGALIEVFTDADASVLTRAAAAVSALPRLERCADVEALRAAIPPPEDPEVAARVAALDQRLLEAKALETAGRNEAGIAIVEQLLPEAEALDHTPLTMRALLRLGHLRMFSGEPDEAEQILTRAYDMALGAGLIDDAADAAAELVYLVGRVRSRPEDGRAWARHAEPLTRATGSSLAMAHLLRYLGQLETSAGDYPRAREYLERSIELHQGESGLEHPHIALALGSLATVATSQGHWAEAKGYYERALEIERASYGENHPNVASSLNNLGIIAMLEGDFEAAEPLLTRALELWTQAHGPEHPDVGRALGNLGTVYVELGELERARETFERARTIFTASYGAEHPMVANTISNLGRIAQRLGDVEGALARYRESLAVFEAALGPEHPELGDFLDNVGSAAMKLGDLEQAEQAFARSLKIRESSLGPDSLRNVSSLIALAEVARRQQRWTEVIEACERALKILDAADSHDPSDPADARLVLADALWNTSAGRDRPRARALAEAALATYAELGERKAESHTEAKTWLAEHEL